MGRQWRLWRSWSRACLLWFVSSMQYRMQAATGTTAAKTAMCVSQTKTECNRPTAVQLEALHLFAMLFIVWSARCHQHWFDGSWYYYSCRPWRGADRCSYWQCIQQQQQRRSRYNCPKLLRRLCAAYGSTGYDAVCTVVCTFILLPNGPCVVQTDRPNKPKTYEMLLLST